LQRDLARLLGEDSILPLTARHYHRDSTEMHGLSGTADAIVAPGSAEQVSELVAWCYDRNLAIVPRGGGTGFAGGAVPVDGGIVCSLERLSQIRRFEPEFWHMEVEAGVITSRIHVAARKSGLFFPPDPGASEQSQIGGNIACNAGGPHAFKYGVTGNWVTGIEAVVASGNVLRMGGSLRKDVAGYDIRSLFVGSEGTLGIITSAWLRLTPAPEKVIPVVAGYRDIASGVRAIGRVYGYGLVPAALEYFDGGTLAASRGSFPGGIEPEVGMLLIAESDGTASEAESLSHRLSEALSEEASFVRLIHERQSVDELWRWRSGVSFAVSAQRGGKMSEDIAVPMGALEETLAMISEIGKRHGLSTCSWGHAGDANLHATFMLDATSETEIAAATRASAELFARTLELGGTVSGEHGLGWVKRDQFDRQFSEESARLQRLIKSAFDPLNLFNPGKKVPMPAASVKERGAQLIGRTPGSE
jgi:glycolate oxidase subunit GlcD